MDGARLQADDGDATTGEARGHAIEVADHHRRRAKWYAASADARNCIGPGNPPHHRTAASLQASVDDPSGGALVLHACPLTVSPARETSMPLPAWGRFDVGVAEHRAKYPDNSDREIVAAVSASQPAASKLTVKKSASLLWTAGVSSRSILHQSCQAALKRRQKQKRSAESHGENDAESDEKRQKAIAEKYNDDGSSRRPACRCRRMRCRHRLRNADKKRLLCIEREIMPAVSSRLRRNPRVINISNSKPSTNRGCRLCCQKPPKWR